MRYLDQYLDQRVNFWRVQVDKKPAITASSMTLSDANDIAEKLVCDMSPENISCDGELSRTEVRARYRLYQNAASDLIKLFPNLTVPEYDEGLFDAPVSLKGQFSRGQKVAVNHPQLGGRQTGFIVKVNRVKCLVEFASQKKYHIPMDLIEII